MTPRIFKACAVSFNLDPSERNRGAVPRTGVDGRRLFALVRHSSALAGLFVQILRLIQEAGLVKLGYVALDGTKIKANASKHKAMSYGNMKKKKEELEKEVGEL
jgi:hypothetical protein